MIAKLAVDRNLDIRENVSIGVGVGDPTGNQTIPALDGGVQIIVGVVMIVLPTFLEQMPCLAGILAEDDHRDEARWLAIITLTPLTDTQTHRHNTYTHTDTQTHRHTDTQTQHIHTHTHTHTDTQTQTHRHNTYTHIHRHTATTTATNHNNNNT